MNPLVTFILVLVGIFIFVAGFTLLYFKNRDLDIKIIELQSAVKALTNMVATDDVILSDLYEHTCDQMPQCPQAKDYTCPYFREGIDGKVYKSKTKVKKPATKGKVLEQLKK